MKNRFNFMFAVRQNQPLPLCHKNARRRHRNSKKHFSFFTLTPPNSLYPEHPTHDCVADKRFLLSCDERSEHKKSQNLFKS